MHYQQDIDTLVRKEFIMLWVDSSVIEPQTIPKGSTGNLSFDSFQEMRSH
jgi:hypothetical protein